MQTPREIVENQKARMVATLPKVGPCDPVGSHVQDIYLAEVMWRALGLMILNDRIRTFLEANDPQALGQVRAAAELWRDHHQEQA